MNRISLTTRILIGFVLGLVLGVWLGPRVAPFGEIGKLVIGLVKILAGPFLFFTILKAVIETPLGKGDAKYLAGVTSINAFFAIVIGVGISSLFTPGRSLAPLTHAPVQPTGTNAWKPPNWSYDEWIKTLVPKSVFEALTENAVLSLAISAVVLGIAVRSVIASLPEADRPRFESWIRTGTELFHHVFQRILTWSVNLAPIAVMAVVAKAVGEKGLSALAGLWVYLVAGGAGLLLQIGVVYLAWVRWAGIPIRTFWRAAKRPAVYSIGTNSSLATLPLTLDALGELKVSERASTLGACIGTNLNNDGILLYEAMAVLFVAQAHGLELALTTKLLVIALCWLATVGIGGVPEAGFVSLSIILTQVGLPLELLPFLLSVDWILARLRSVVNVCCDMVTSIVIDRWMQSDQRS